MYDFGYLMTSYILIIKHKKSWMAIKTVFLLELYYQHWAWYVNSLTLSHNIINFLILTDNF